MGVFDDLSCRGFILVEGIASVLISHSKLASRESQGHRIHTQGSNLLPTAPEAVALSR